MQWCRVGFASIYSPDLAGFVDGTANPKEDLRFDAALIPSGKPGQGGSIALTQKWPHDLAVFNAEPIATQEAVSGCTKVDDVELRGDDMPANSHVSRTDGKVNGARPLWGRTGWWTHVRR